MNFQVMKTLIQRELWEHKAIFLIAKVAFTLFTVLLVFNLLLAPERPPLLELFTQVADYTLADKKAIATGYFGLLGLATIFSVFIVFPLQLYYFNGSFFNERNDRSVLFWRSLPIADSASILSKFITGSFIYPIIYMLMISLWGLSIVIVWFFICSILSLTTDISLWHTLLQANIFASIGTLWSNSFLYIVFMMPVFSWLMLVSVMVKKSPFLWATLPLVFILFTEYLLFRHFSLPQQYISQFFTNYFSFPQGYFIQFKLDGTQIPVEVLYNTSINILREKLNICMPLVAGSMVYLSYWLRKNHIDS